MRRTSSNLSRVFLLALLAAFLTGAWWGGFFRPLCHAKQLTQKSIVEVIENE